MAIEESLGTTEKSIYISNLANNYSGAYQDDEQADNTDYWSHR
jgi:hypothetical protein